MSRLIDAVKLMQDFTMRQGDIPYNVFYGVIKDTVDKQVTAEQESGWIPCSERLPKENEPILGTVEVENELMVMELIFYNDWLKGKYELIAWQPLPQPYKESESNGAS